MAVSYHPSELHPLAFPPSLNALSAYSAIFENEHAPAKAPLQTFPVSPNTQGEMQPLDSQPCYQTR